MYVCTNRFFTPPRIDNIHNLIIFFSHAHAIHFTYIHIDNHARSPFFSHASAIHMHIHTYIHKYRQTYPVIVFSRASSIHAYTYIHTYRHTCTYSLSSLKQAPYIPHALVPNLRRFCATHVMLHVYMYVCMYVCMYACIYASIVCDMRHITCFVYVCIHGCVYGYIPKSLFPNLSRFC
jgi:hypothetical protein